MGEMNTSMTINATAAWLLGLYIANAERTGVDPKALAGTTQNDIIKEYLSRGTFIFPPEASRRLTVDTIAYTVRHAPKWNPINVCSYHLQEAGATPVQELAYALATAVGVLDAVRESGQVPAEEFPTVVGRISFFVNSGIRFVEETCKMRAFARLWDDICRYRYGVEDPKLRRLRYGVQVNSLGLTESQPENNVQRIVLETLGVTLSRDARARAIQLPAWNEALGLPAAVGPAVVAPDPAGARLRDGSARARGHLRRLPRGGSKDGGAGRGGQGGAGRGHRHGWRLRGHRRAQGPPGAQPVRAHPSHRDGRAQGDRRQLLHRHGAVAAEPDNRGRGARGQLPHRRSGGRGEAARRRRRLAPAA